MLKNYIKIAFRNLLKHKGYSYINIFGLAIGIACVLLISLYIYNEINYDSFHKNADRIYRVNSHIKVGGMNMSAPLTSDPMGQVMKDGYPDIEEFTRIYTFSGGKLIKKGDQFYNENGIAYVDSTFFNVFSFPVIAGEPKTALQNPNSVVLTERMAKKYFGTTDAIGRYLVTNDEDGKEYQVTAVLEDVPSNSHFQFDFLFPIQNVNYNWGFYLSYNFYTYFLLREGANPKNFNNYFQEYNAKYVFPLAKELMNIKSKEEFEKAGNKVEHYLMPLKDIHLYSKLTFELTPSGTIQYVYIFSAVALFILLIACINFMNLTTARSANRAREVGIRKVLGTERKSLILQFLAESTLMAFLAILVSFLLIFFALPFFNQLVDKKLEMSTFFTSSILPFIILLPIIIGFIAGSYPAFYLSRFEPGEIIKGKLRQGNKSFNLRSALVVFQFAATIILITGTIVIYNQLNYVQNINLGYDKEQVLVIDNFYLLGNNSEAFKNEMLGVSGVKKATISGFLPIPSNRNNNMLFKDASMGTENSISMQQWSVDYDYFETIGIKFKEGRNFSRQFSTDSSATIINEAAAKQLGFDDPLGKYIYSFTQSGQKNQYKIIGVIKDFNYESLRQEIGPQCFQLGNSTSLASFKINTANISNILDKTESIWNSLAPGMPFSFRFMDESYNELYKSEKNIGMIALIFAVLAIVIACLGLLGLATFLAEQKTKEIGIRKVLGASVSSVVLMLSKEFIKWIVIANIIAWPLAYYFMNKWLEDFAYRIDISWWLFVIAGITTLIIALLTVSYKSLKAATANPAKSLKYE